MTLKDEPLRLVGVQYASGKEWRNAPERMNTLNQSRNDVQLWTYLHLVVKVKSDPIKNNTA